MKQSVRPRVLYISYDGMAEPLGKSQVLAYLRVLAKQFDIHLISYEKPEDWSDAALRKELAGDISAAGIHWHPLRYHKKPTGPATLFDICQGLFLGAWLVLTRRIGIVHARSYVPSVIALGLKKIFGCKYIFDMRGFWADERVDGGLWARNSRLYRVSKWFERRFLLASDCVVSLTQAAIVEMQGFHYLRDRLPRFEQITTCADLAVFSPAAAPVDEVKPFVLGYVGSVGTWYLFDEALRSFQHLQTLVPDARMHVLNKGGHVHIRERMQALHIDENAVIVEEADHLGVARAMQKMDAGVFFIKPVYSKTASAPTKLGEFLGCGVPCLGNTKVGDVSDILLGERVGVVIDDFSDDCLKRAVHDLLKLSRETGVSARCRAVAEENYSLDEGVKRYTSIYQGLLKK